MLTILFMVACASEEELVRRDAVWVEFQTECLANGTLEAALRALPACYSQEVDRCGHKAAEEAVAESNARIDSLVEKRKRMESEIWIAPVTWRCVDGLAYGKYVNH